MTAEFQPQTILGVEAEHGLLESEFFLKKDPAAELTGASQAQKQDQQNKEKGEG